MVVPGKEGKSRVASRAKRALASRGCHAPSASRRPLTSGLRSRPVPELLAIAGKHRGPCNNRLTHPSLQQILRKIQIPASMSDRRAPRRRPLHRLDPVRSAKSSPLHHILSVPWLRSCRRDQEAERRRRSAFRTRSGAMLREWSSLHPADSEPPHSQLLSKRQEWASRNRQCVQNGKINSLYSCFKGFARPLWDPRDKAPASLNGLVHRPTRPGSPTITGTPWR